MENLHQNCILGSDGQTQLRVRIDWDQQMIRFNGEPIPFNKSAAESLMNIGGLNSLQAFKDKVQRYTDRQLEFEHYQPVVRDEVYDDPVSDKYTPTGLDSITINGNLTGKQLKAVNILLNDYSHLFDPVTSCAKGFEHKITLTDQTPVKSRAYRLSPVQEVEMQKEIDKMLKDGTIRKSKSAYASPALLVPKPDRSW